MDNTIIQQGTFTSSGANTFIALRSDVDWMAVYNLTQGAASQTTAVGVKYYWQREFAANSKWTTFKSNAANAANLEQYIVGNGFNLFDTSQNSPNVLNTNITAISNANPPVVSAVNTLTPGSVVRIINVVGAQQLGGMDFTVGNSTLTTGTFSLDYMTPIVTATTGSWRQIPFGPLFYPRRRYITNISQAAQAVITLSVTHLYQVGQAIRVVVPPAFGMVEINNLIGNILAVNLTNNTITVDINSTAFTAFAFPLTAAVPFTPAETVPVGEDTSLALALDVNILSDATLNVSSIGIMLTGGANNPGGANNDVMTWVAGKSFSTATT